MEKQIRDIIGQHVGGTYEAKQKCAEEILRLFSLSGCFTIGAKIQITKCIYGHEYEIGEVVTIIDHEEENNQTTSWLCRNVHGKEWYINEEEGVPLNNH